MWSPTVYYYYYSITTWGGRRGAAKRITRRNVNTRAALSRHYRQQPHEGTHPIATWARPGIQCFPPLPSPPSPPQRQTQHFRRQPVNLPLPRCRTAILPPHQKQPGKLCPPHPGPNIKNPPQPGRTYQPRTRVSQGLSHAGSRGPHPPSGQCGKSFGQPGTQGGLNFPRNRFCLSHHTTMRNRPDVCSCPQRTSDSSQLPERRQDPSSTCPSAEPTPTSTPSISL